MVFLFLVSFFAAQAVPLVQEDPDRAPQLASDQGVVGLAFGAGHDLYFRASHDMGKSFGTRVKVAEAAVVPLGRHRGPRIAMTRGAIIISAVMGATAGSAPHGHGLPSDGDLVAWRSVDDGSVRLRNRDGLPALRHGKNLSVAVAEKEVCLQIKRE